MGAGVLLGNQRGALKKDFVGTIPNRSSDRMIPPTLEEKHIDENKFLLQGPQRPQRSNPHKYSSQNSFSLLCVLRSQRSGREQTLCLLKP